MPTPLPEPCATYADDVPHHIPTPSTRSPEVFSKAFVCDGLDRASSVPGLNGIGDTLPVDTLTQHEPGSKLTPLLPSRRDQPVMEWAGVNDDWPPRPPHGAGGRARADVPTPRSRAGRRR